MYARIGITTSFEEGEQRLSHTYVQAVERAGGLPLIVPMLRSDAAYADFARELDALIITGGPAISEGLIGTLPPDLLETDPVRAEADRRILEAFLAARKPVLGICYGMQLLNAQAGGKIYADVQKQLDGAVNHSNKRGADGHPIHIEAGSHLRERLGRDEAWVNTRHIQAISTVGQGFRVAATAPDGVVEAIESADGVLMGVQFHPEHMDEMLPLFQELVERAEQNRMVLAGGV